MTSVQKKLTEQLRPTAYTVAVNAAVQQTFTYAQPTESTLALPVGCVVLVPFGRGKGKSSGRLVTGYILAALDKEDIAKLSYTLKPIATILSDTPLFSPKMLEFYEWIARYYHHPLGEVISTALPLSPRAKTGYLVRLTEEGQAKRGLNGDDNDTGGVSDAESSWQRQLFTQGELSPAVVQGIRQQPKQHRLLKKMAEQGLVEISQVLRTGGKKAKTEKVLVPGQVLQRTGHPDVDNFSAFVQRVEEQSAYSLKPADKKALQVFYQLSDQAETTASPTVRRKDFSGQYKSCHVPLKRLQDAGILAMEERQVYRNPFADRLAPSSLLQTAPDKGQKASKQRSDMAELPELTPDQQAVMDTLAPALLPEAGFRSFLLFGVTGSGKTEIYLRATAQVLAEGKTVVVLVPEIALASQIETHFHARFGDSLALLHSGLSDGERFDQWQRIAQGKAQVVIGARSAIFAPVLNPGLFIVDEEHEPAYKQDDGLRYNGRDLAVLRARYANCPVLLGSATPSVVSYHHAMQGKYQLLTLPKRVHARPLPAVQIVDLTEVKKSRPELCFTDELTLAITENLDQGKQTLLFVNRRGFSSSMLCTACGTILECKHCQVSLTYHRHQQALLCHYCGFTLSTKTLCPTCNSPDLRGIGVGAERVEQEARELFPEARVARLDSDTSSGNRKKYKTTLQAVANGEVDILVGTQMIAKGLHFPGITLVGVILADAGLGLPDYKASERVFSVLSQVTGRAGRGQDEGRVLIQTHQPSHYALGFACTHDYQGLYEQELVIRQTLGFPPFARLANLKFQGRDEHQVSAEAENTAAWLHEHKRGQGCEILGPAPAPLVKVRDTIRWQILLKSADLHALHGLCASLLAKWGRKGQPGSASVKLIVDIDPDNML